MTYEFKKPSQPLSNGPIETSFTRASVEARDPNKDLARPIREVLATAAGPICGQTRDLLFLCRGDEEFDAIEEALRNTFTENDLLQDDDFKIKKMVTTPEKGGEQSYITGEVCLTIPAKRYTNKQIDSIASQAYRHVSDQNNPQQQLNN